MECCRTLVLLLVYTSRNLGHMVNKEMTVDIGLLLVMCDVGFSWQTGLWVLFGLPGTA